MARGPKRRTVVFVDYSALRDALKKNRWLSNGVEAHNLDFKKLGELLSGEGEFIRLNLYTATPVEVENRPNDQFIHNIQVYEHEAFKANSIQRGFQDLINSVNQQPSANLHCGRMVVKRVQLKHGETFQWVQEVLRSLPDNTSTQDTLALFQRAAQVNSDAKAARTKLSEIIVELKEQGKIPAHMMGSYYWRMTELLDEQLSYNEKGVDTCLTVQMMEHCMNDAFDDAILFAADEDYIPLVEAVKRTGRRVIHAFWETQTPGRPLQQVCDDSILLGQDDIRNLFLP